VYRVSIPGSGKEFLLSAKLPHRLWATQPRIQLLRVKAQGDVNLTSHLHIVSRLGIRGATHLLSPYIMTWCLSKQRDNLQNLTSADRSLNAAHHLLPVSVTCSMTHDCTTIHIPCRYQLTAPQWTQSVAGSDVSAGYNTGEIHEQLESGSFANS
jgi:hypothetical protein